MFSILSPVVILNLNKSSMLKSIAKKLVVALVFCSLFISVSFLPGLTAPSMAAIAQKANTILIEVGSSSKDDLEDLESGEGELYKKIASAVERLKDSGAIDPEAQPVIFVVEQKKDDDVWGRY